MIVTNEIMLTIIVYTVYNNTIIIQYALGSSLRNDVHSFLGRKTAVVHGRNCLVIKNGAYFKYKRIKRKIYFERLITFQSQSSQTKTGKN